MNAPSQGIKVVDIAHVRFGCPDLDVMQSFLEDFGMRHVPFEDDDVLYMRGIGSSPFLHVTERSDTSGFRGVAFRAESIVDLETLASGDTFSQVTDLHSPGGGHAVRGTDPDGVVVDVVFGQELVDQQPTPERQPGNHADDRPRVGEPVRIEPGPANVVRLGHCVLDVGHYPTTAAWYADHLGLRVSDEIARADETALGAFMRCDRGSDFVDHHTMFFVGTGNAGFNHAAYEVADFDDLMAGHSHLATQDHTHHWGVGRHILGSQIYDYWRDPFGHVLEHWTDGDLFNDETPPRRATVRDLLGSQWGPTHTAP